jgi:DMSO/TMAO reductase YedYZ molybdopterin-dependent catalytic subunit
MNKGDASINGKTDMRTSLLAMILTLSLVVLSGFWVACKNGGIVTSGPQSSVSTGTVEVEATEFLGQKLTPVTEQRNNALIGTQNIDRDTYRLTVDGQVEKSLSLTYDDLMAYPQISKLMDLNCVEGWDFTAKWTGPMLSSVFDDAGIKPEAVIAIFYTTDVSDKGYTSLPLNYIKERNIIIGLKLNDLILPPSRGFPFQVVAESKYGYKWAKWVNRIELSSNQDFKGYWESYGYNNNADIDGPELEDGRPLYPSSQ